jgi:FKBP-type peptidyl-prolyl cis-trans isomerase FkpA
MKTLPSLLLGWLTSPAPAATAAAPAPTETARPAPSAVAATQPQTEEQKVLYAMGLNIGRNIAVFNLTAGPLGMEAAGIEPAPGGAKPL